MSVSLNQVKYKPIKSNLTDVMTCNYRPPKCISAADHNCCVMYHAYAAHMKIASDVPRSASQIHNMPDATQWRDATAGEIQNMYDNTVWSSPSCRIKDIPKHLLLPSQLIYEKQYNPDGSFKKYKCRLVIRGDKWHDIYNMNKYASTVKSESVRMLLSIAAIEDMEMESIDVKSAFLYSNLKDGEIIYMRRPAGLTDADMPEIVQLNKCIYGMPEASAYFHEHSDAALKSFGCIPTPEDDCVYVLDYKGERAYISKHVDDFGLMSKSQQLIDYIKRKLSDIYTITVNADMSYYLGFHIIRERTERSILLSQRGCIDTVLDRFNVTRNATSIYPSTPMEYIKMSKSTPIVLLTPSQIIVKVYSDRITPIPITLKNIAIFKLTDYFRLSTISKDFLY